MSIVAENRGQLLDTLPPLIRQMTSQEMWDTDETGLSQAAVFCGKKMVLKIEKENSTADQEYHMLSWLQGKLPVPRLLAFERKDGRNYLLILYRISSLRVRIPVGESSTILKVFPSRISTLAG